jgi:hypothetical protein
MKTPWSVKPMSRRTQVFARLVLVCLCKRFSNLIGGVLMVLIGVLLIFKPGWLMFG